MRADRCANVRQQTGYYSAFGFFWGEEGREAALFVVAAGNFVRAMCVIWSGEYNCARFATTLG